MRIVMFTLLLIAGITGLGMSMALGVIGIHMMLHPLIDALEVR